MKFNYFDLQETLAGKPVVTISGLDVVIGGYSKAVDKEYYLIGWVNNIPYAWDADGKAYNGYNDCDLIMKKNNTPTRVTAIAWLKNNWYSMTKEPTTGESTITFTMKTLDAALEIEKANIVAAYNQGEEQGYRLANQDELDYDVTDESIDGYTYYDINYGN